MGDLIKNDYFLIKKMYYFHYQGFISLDTTLTIRLYGL